MTGVEPSGEWFIRAFQAPDAKEGHHPHRMWDLEQSFDFIFFEPFHGRSVIAQSLGCPHHGGQCDHDMAIYPKIKARLQPAGLPRGIAEQSNDVLSHSLPLFLSKTVLSGFAEHPVEIAIFPALWVATRHYHRTRCLHLGLIECSLAQLFLLLAVTHDNEPPGLQIVSARCRQTRADDLLQVSAVDGNVFKTGRRSALQ